MLIEEMIGYPFSIYEGIAIELQNAVDDIILRARKGNIKSLNLRDLAGELNKSVGIYIDPDDPEFRQTLIDVLEQNDWVQQVAPTGKIIIKKANEFQPNEGKEPGEEMQKGRDEQSKKVQKMAAKNVKAKAGGGDKL